MKRIVLLIALSLVCFSVTAQTIVEKEYHFGQPTITHIEGYDQIQLKGCLQSAPAGQPSLPWQNVSLMLPQGQEAVFLEVELFDFQELEGNHQLYPYQSARTYSNPERKAFEKDETLYASKSVYPAQSYGQLTTQYMNGIGFAFSAFSPVQYIPSEGKVLVATKAIVRVATAASKADQSRRLWLTPENVRRASRLAQNSEMLQSYDAKGRAVGGYEILVITTQPYVSQFEAYQDFYLQRGLRSRVVDVNTIYNTVSGQDNQEKIRNYIIQEYENNGILMVNLGGDVPSIPYRGFYCDVLTGGSHETDNDIPSDLYYAALDGTWNDNGNNRWGEIGEDDLLPEVAIGRMCFSSQTEFNNIMNKTFTYQTDPVLGEFHKVIMGGEHLYDDPVSNGSQYLELLIGEHNDNGYTTVGIPENYVFTRLYEEQGNWSASLLRNAINAGTQYVHHDGHANTNYVAGWTNSDITDANFSGANGINHNYTFFHTSGCICGDFSSDCILEKMTKIANFAVATIGNSRYGWFNEGQTEGPAIHLHRETEDAYYHDRIPYAGLAMAECKIQTAPWVNAPGQWEEGALRWNFYDLNLMGDVAVSPWHDEPFTPEVSYATEILVGLSSTDVNVTDANGNGLYNFRCSLFHGDELIGTAQTDADGNAHLEFESPIDFVDEMSLIVTGCDAWPQVLPVISIPGNCAYIIYDNCEVHDDNGQADFGENVTLNMQFKNVGTVASGTVTATLTTDNEYVTIVDGTETLSSIGGSATLNIEDAFGISISDAVPDGTKALFMLSCTDGTDTWQSNFSLTLCAPRLSIVNVVIDDSEGNNNGCVDPGETITLHITAQNTGMSDAPGTTFEIFCQTPEISFDQYQFNIGDVEASETYHVDFTFTLDAESQTGIAYQMALSTASGNYETEEHYIFVVGNIIEDFETGDFSKFEWINNSDQPWVVLNSSAYEGSHCAKSGTIGSDQSSILSISLEIATEGEVSFFKKVSSEANYDKLYFFIDSQEMGEWSGDVQWSLETYPLTSGQHQLIWEYSKDFSVSSGQDCAWIDNIVFPPTDLVTVVTETYSTDLAVYPNPSNGSFNINLPEENCEITVFNGMGQQVYYQGNANGLTQLHLESLGKGMYYITVKSACRVNTQKIVIK